MNEADLTSAIIAQGTSPMHAETQTETLNCALFYASIGLPVFPLHSYRNGLCTCNKVDCESPGKHPHYDRDALPNGFQDATTDPSVITAWWEHIWPDANIGIATGNGLVVLDVDTKTGGPDSLAELCGSMAHCLNLPAW